MTETKSSLRRVRATERAGTVEAGETGEIAGRQRIENGVEWRKPSMNPSHRLEVYHYGQTNQHQ